jgi:hypothetical protein
VTTENNSNSQVNKKHEFKDDEIPISDAVCVCKRGEYWQFRMWLAKENKYARESLRTRSEIKATKFIGA